MNGDQGMGFGAPCAAADPADAPTANIARPLTNSRRVSPPVSYRLNRLEIMLSIIRLLWRVSYSKHATCIPLGEYGRQAGVSRHAKCYRAIYRRARNRVTHERTHTWGRPEWDHKRHESIWRGCGGGT